MSTLFKLITRVFVAIINRLRGLLGYPPPPRPEQIGERLVTMRCDGGRDCAAPVTANSCSAAAGVVPSITYEQAHDALNHADLPGPLESPLLSNPEWLILAIRKLGFQAKKITLTELLNGELPPGRVIMLVHKSGNWLTGTLNQHWVTYEGMNSTYEWLFHWGKNQNLVVKNKAEVVELFTTGTPNCILLVSR